VYLSIGDGSATSNTAVALTGCIMTDNTAPGLCYCRSDGELCVVCVGLMCLVSGCFRQ
jgi:hypothetical protein